MKNLITDYNKIKEILRDNSIYKEEYKKLIDLEDRGIQLEGYQANLMFLKRRYGKTFMSYCLLAEDILEIFEDKDCNDDMVYLVSKDWEITLRDKISFPILYLEIYTEFKEDIDEFWIKGFIDFIGKYFNDVFSVEKNDSKIIIKRK